MSTSIHGMLNNPLMGRDSSPALRPQGFLRLVLAEAANYGMPPQVVASLDDVAAILGYHDALSANQVAHLAGPLTMWRTHRSQPTYEQVADIEALAYKQRCLVAFGGAPPGHMVGTAEIVYAMGNVHQDFLEREQGVDGAYREVFNWASIDVLATLSGQPKDRFWKDKGWKPIDDEEVVKPTGRLYAAYTEMATYIRRTTISWLEGRTDHPRKLLEPLAKVFLDNHRTVLQRATERGETELLPYLREACKAIEDMFPSLKLPEPNPTAP